MGVVEFLRPFVETKAWDYVVVWKYGNDPTRYKKPILLFISKLLSSTYTPQIRRVLCRV